MSEEDFKGAIRFILVASLAIAMLMVLFYAGKEAGCGVMFAK